MVRYKEKAKRKLYVEKEEPLTTTNKYGVQVRGLPVSSSEIGVSSLSAKRCRSSGGVSNDEKDKEKVSASA